jgi:hypothetical protein
MTILEEEDAAMSPSPMKDVFFQREGQGSIDVAPDGSQNIMP